MILSKKGKLLLFLGSQMLVMALFFHISGHRDFFQTEEPKRPMHVLVLSSWRSGSSFVGQVFGQHPDVFYLMEPAWHVWMSFTSSTAWKLHMAVRDLLRSTFLCDMSVFDAYMKPGPRKQSSLFQWEQSRALCSSPVCDFFSSDQISSAEDCKLLCAQQPFDMVEKACRSHSHVVLKEVRFFNLQALHPLLTDPSLNLHVVHLVRDPRAVFRSRERTRGDLMIDSKIVLGEHLKIIKEKDHPYYTMQIICKSHVDIVKAIQALPEVLQQRFLLLRYEDLVREPLAQTSRLYKFVGLKFLPHLHTWVHNVTRGKGMGQHTFDTNSRDAVNVSQAWRWSLPYEKVSQLQDACSEAMDLLGYRKVRSQQEQGNLSLDLLSSSPKLGQVQ
ncbi:carbohydrate sulfotransferase 4 [Cricetulus griseus]|uniref:Sulfotransferase n=1 Tax=Cricetulus griseus TaxID=10029 RepID=G3HAG3_CRIGR|nr:carbohydrate sulfotransferase 4 [Cricetulus griseus]XP_035310877.1 carbohydrate sulfotransferase 4 [Cricetulus griseus]EGW04127.1 Carbohydrate sulfotransferase 4 [Cricetulus griseus]ERE78891.1 carbohydrate sulfotransferase 4-like protein [Cricetulus griseus]